MCISPETLSEIEAALTEFHNLSPNPLALLRSCFPELSFVRLSAGDIDDAPFRKLPHYNLYLLDIREQNVQITNDPEIATGVVIAAT